MGKGRARSKTLIIKGKKDSTESVLNYSSGMECSWNEMQEELQIEIGSDKAGIPYATCNMRQDYADFEGIVFAVLSVLPECRIILKYDSFGWDKWEEDAGFPLAQDKVWKNGRGKDRTITASELQHYMRFLYRVWKMASLYGTNFVVHEDNAEEITFFADQYKKADLHMTKPKSESDITENSVFEKYLEKWFVLNSGERAFSGKVDELVNKCGKIILYDQFPCGLFCGPKSEENRIFNKGAFDLWGVDDKGRLCLFELKKQGNAKLGIISELFFYSCVLNDLTEAARENARKSYRGYLDFPKEKREICAYFLAPDFYSFMNDKEDLAKIINVMNKRGDNVCYGAIRFDQETIVGENEEEFKEKLRKEWKRR